MQKAHSLKNWENYPSINTPLNAQNLNELDVSVDVIDDRVVTIDTTKATKEEVSTLIKEIQFAEGTGIFTITRKNGSKFTIDTKLEKIAINFGYDPLTQRISLTLIDGTVQYIDLSALITQYEFLDTDTVSFFVDSNGKISAIVKEGSIEEKHLRPDYLAEIKVEVAKAQSSQQAAATSEANAKASENAAKTSQTAAATSAANAKTSETNAKVSETNSKASETASKASQTAAKTSETNAAASANTATAKATAASTSASQAATSALNAASSANTAGAKADEASNYSGLSKSYAVGTDGQVRENDNADCSQYYYEQAKRISQSLSGVIPMGTITFDDLDNANNRQPGYLFNISNSFISDDRFTDGGGIFYGAGSNVLYTADGKWDVLAASMVSGVKGNAETEYRQGFINITPANIGLDNVDNTADADKSVKYATKAAQDNDGNQINTTYLKTTGDSKDNTVTFTSGDSASPTEWDNIETIVSDEKHSSLFRKLSLAVKNVRYLYKMLGTTNISTIGDGTVTGAIDAVNTDIFINKGVVADIDDVNMSFAVHATNNNTAGTFPASFTKAGYVEHIRRTSNIFSQRYTEISTNPRMAVRIYNGSWSPWKQLVNKDDVSENVKITVVQFPTSVSLVANQASYLTMTLDNIAGYTPVIFDISLTGGAGIVPYGKNLNMFARIVRIDAINLSNTTVTMQPTIRVLWVRDDLL